MTEPIPAFPRPASKPTECLWCNSCGREVEASAQSGMSLRDYFAGQALVGLCAEYGLSDLSENADKAAREAFALADAMLCARALPSPKDQPES